MHHMALKLPWYETALNLPDDGKTSWLLPPSLVSLLSYGTIQSENIYSFVLKVAGQVWES